MHAANHPLIREQQQRDHEAEIEAARIAQLMRPYQDRLKAVRRLADHTHRQLSAVYHARNKRMDERGLLNPPATPHFRNTSLDTKPDPCEVSRLDDDIDHLEREIETLSDRWRPQAALISACEKWFSDHCSEIIDGTIRRVSLPDAPKKTSVDALRADIARLAREQDTLERIFPSEGDALEKLTTELKYQAKRGLESIGSTALLRHGRLTDAMHHLAGRDAIGLMAYLIGPEQMARRLLDHGMSEHPDAGISHDQRAARLAEIALERHRIECEEESLIRASEQTGNPIQRRPEADPAVVLTPDA